MKKTLKIGTRTSALAMAQTKQIMAELLKLHPDLDIQIVGIKVSADESSKTAASEKPLWQLDASETNFFSKELDDALLRDDVDCTVHSFKDLGTERPAGLRLAAVPKRQPPHDIILFHPQILDHIAQGKTIIVGSSAPRRMTNVPPFLQRALPQLATINIEIKPIRGNVNSRIKRLFEPDGSERRVDAVVLALAGVSRLHQSGLLQDELQTLPKMILPLSLCPGAPGQGALALECRSSDEETFGIVHSLNDALTEFHIQRERKKLVEQGGGCHQKFGASSVPHPRFENGIMFVYGENTRNEKLNELVWQKPDAAKCLVQAWDGMNIRRGADHAKHELPVTLPQSARAVFVSHSRAVTDAVVPFLKTNRVWTSGTKSWFDMAEENIWVEGCADGLGIDFIQGLLSTACLSLPDLEEWTIITNKEAIAGWPNGHIIASYSADHTIPDDALNTLKFATHIFWGSSFQFDQYKTYFNPSAHHACGAGKTADYLTAQRIENLTVFPSRKEWQNWLNL